MFPISAFPSHQMDL